MKTDIFCKNSQNLEQATVFMNYGRGFDSEQRVFKNRRP